MRLAYVIFSAMLCLLIGAQTVQIAWAQQISAPNRLNELRSLRDKLQLGDSLRDSDITVILNERALSAAAQQLIGLEFLLSKGGVLKVTSVESELKPAAAIVKIGIQAKTSVTVNLQLIGRINSGELEKGSLRLPLRVTEVKLMNGKLSSLFMKTLFGEWLDPGKWNKELPAIEIPTDIAETMRIPAGHFDVGGEIPMEISTPDYEAPLKFTVTSLLVLDKRAVITLRLDQGEPPAAAIPASFMGVNDNDQAALEDEIARLTESLNSSSDLRVTLNRRVINTLLAQMTAANNADFNIHLKRGRIRSEQVNVIVNVTNYTDVESGEGRADVTQLNIEQIADGKVTLRLSGQGEVDARLRGREYGVPYTISPRMTFSIKDQPLPLEFASEEKKIFLRAAPGATLPINVQFNLKVAGQDLSFSRQSVAQADKWLNRIDLPSFFDREISLPRKMEIDAGGNLHITEKRNLGYTLSNMRIGAKNDALEITADVKFNQPK